MKSADSTSPPPIRWPSRLLLVAVPVWVGSAVFVWWALGVHLDAADDRRAEPAWVTRWDGPAVVLAAAAFFTICVRLAAWVRAARRG